MRTSWINTKWIDQYLQKQLSSKDQINFQQQIQRSDDLRREVILQSQLMYLVKLYHQKAMKRDLTQIFDRLMNSVQHTEFKETIISIFNK